MSTAHTPAPKTDAAYLATLQWASRHPGSESTERKLDAIMNDPRPPTGWETSRKMEWERDALLSALQGYLDRHQNEADGAGSKECECFECRTARATLASP